MFRTLLCLLAIVPIAFGSCELGEPEAAGEVEPDTVALGVRQVTVSSNGRVEVLATMVETFGKEDLSVFYGAEISEIDSDGVTILEGGADRIEVKGRKDGSALGNVFVKNLKEESSLRADSMKLDDDKRELTGQGSVQVDLGDGLSISGETFVVDLARKTYVFMDGVEGTIEFGEDE